LFLLLRSHCVSRGLVVAAAGSADTIVVPFVPSLTLIALALVGLGDSGFRWSGHFSLLSGFGGASSRCDSAATAHLVGVVIDVALAARTDCHRAHQK
jgi:hypothetical protein